MPGSSRTRMFVGLARPEQLDPEDVREVDVVQRDQLVQVPELVRAEEVPVRPAEERAQQDQDDPEHEEAVLERDVGELALVDRVVAVARLVGVDVGHRHQADDDQARQHDAGHPRVEVDEHLLEAEEVPGGLRRVRGRRSSWPAARAGPAARSPRRPGRSSARPCRSARCRPGRARSASSRARAPRGWAAPAPSARR